MLELFRDPLWQFIGAVFGALSFLGYLFVEFRKQRSKELDFKIVSRTSSKGDEIVIFKIYNSGTVPILPSDQLQPITFIFGDFTEILDAEIVDSNPEHLEIPLQKIGMREIRLAPFLLNPGEWINIKVILTTFDEVRINFRMIGVKGDGLIISGITKPQNLEKQTELKFEFFPTLDSPFRAFLNALLLDVVFVVVGLMCIWGFGIWTFGLPNALSYLFQGIGLERVGFAIGSGLWLSFPIGVDFYLKTWYRRRQHLAYKYYWRFVLLIWLIMTILVFFATFLMPGYKYYIPMFGIWLFTVAFLLEAFVPREKIAG